MRDQKQKKKVIFLMGPTAAGKTRAAVCLAKQIGAEIINCDSMQVYKDMGIITSAPPAALRKEVPHYLFDFIVSSRSYDACRFSSAAREKIREITARDRIPLFVGGSGLYMKAVIDGFFTDAGADLKLRASLNKLSEKVLFSRLKKVDPVSAQAIHPHNKRRVIRALEIYYKNKAPVSSLRHTRDSIEDKYDFRVFALNMSREALYERINKRTDEMFRQGLLAEIKKLSGKRISKTARLALGVRELLEYLRGNISLEEAKNLIKRNTRRYAKRQLTWFRGDKRVNWIDVSPEQHSQDIAEILESKLIKSAETKRKA